MSDLDERTIERVSGPAWNNLRDTFLRISDILLSVDNEATSELTTIYVKFFVGNHQTGMKVYAVVWLKKSTELVIGLALPPTVDSLGLVDPPPQKKYAGLTRYLIIKEADSIPPELKVWAQEAYRSLK